jgi:carbamoyl-phosphate synthase large subunit
VAVAHNVPLITTISGAAASVNGIEALLKEEIQVKPLQEYHKPKA